MLFSPNCPKDVFLQLVYIYFKLIIKTNMDIYQNNPLRKSGKDINRHFTEADTQMVSKHTKRCSTSLALRETQIIITTSYH